MPFVWFGSIIKQLVEHFYQKRLLHCKCEQNSNLSYSVIYETTQFVSNTAVQERAIKSNARAYTFLYSTLLQWCVIWLHCREKSNFKAA
jgi:hypothetical protein